MSELSFIGILWLELIGGLLRALHYYALSVKKITDQILEPEEFKCHFIVRYTIVARYSQTCLEQPPMGSLKCGC